jgi:hypothetical protein
MRRGILSVEQVELAAYVHDPAAWRALEWPGEPGRAMVGGRIIKVPGGIDSWLSGLQYACPLGYRRTVTKCSYCAEKLMGILCSCRGTGILRSTINWDFELVIRVLLSLCKAAAPFYNNPSTDQKAIHLIELWLADPNPLNLRNCRWMAHSGESSWVEQTLLYLYRTKRVEGRAASTAQILQHVHRRLQRVLIDGVKVRTRLAIRHAIAPWALNPETFK